MRITGRIATMSFALLVGACADRAEKPAATAVPPAPPGDLSAVPQTYQRMRFVSSIERSREAAPARRSTSVRRAERMAPSHVRDPIAALVSQAPVAVATPVATSSEPAFAVAVRTTPEPARVSEEPIYESPIVDYPRADAGQEYGGVVIRGRPAGTGKCDPRSEAQARGQLAGRPTFGLPVPTGQAFGGASSGGMRY